jgi:hypothetical protein
MSSRNPIKLSEDFMDLITPPTLWYFAHPVSDYGTGFEARVQRMLTNFGLSIENPNQPHHQDGYLAKRMDYFLDDVLPACVGCVFLPFKGGLIGSGVAMEIEHFLDRGQQVLEIAADHGGPLVLLSFRSLDESKVLNREETRGVTKVMRSLPNGGRAYV